MARTSSKTKVKPAANFLEALQNLGKEVISDVNNQAAQVFSNDLPDSFGFGQPAHQNQLNRNESFSMDDVLAAEKRGEQNAGRLFSQQREEDRVLAARREQQAQAQIKSLQEEIQMLAKSLGEFGREAQIAALQSPINPGVYHKNFFEQLKSFIKTMRQRIQESRHWLATQNSRAQKRKGFYWGNVQKSGTKYMLSSERYMVTTTG
jgi:hypothetical protein